MKFAIDFDKYLGFLDVPPTPLIGLDVSSSVIKMVELSRIGRSKMLSLDGYAIEPTPKDAFGDHGVANPESLGDAIQRCWKKLSTRTKNVAIALPASAVIQKRVRFSMAFDDDALGDEVLVEANQHIPFSIDEVNIDWRILGPMANHGQDTEAEDNEVLICAARKNRIEEFLAAIEIGGLKALVMDIEPFAQQAAFQLITSNTPALHDQAVALIDAGSSFMNINIFQRGNIIFTKDIPFGSHQLTDSICNAYGISEAEAEEAKRRNGNGLENFQAQILSPFLDSMGMEINRALQFFLTQATVEQINTIILSGGCAAFEGADQAVADITQIQTMIANPFTGMELSSKLKNKNLQTETPLLITACGLALRAFD